MTDTLLRILEGAFGQFLSVLVLAVIGTYYLESFGNRTRSVLKSVVPHTLTIVVGLSLAVLIAIGFAALVPLICLWVVWALRRSDAAAVGFRIEYDRLHLALAILGALLLGLLLQTSTTDFSAALSANSIGTWAGGPMAAISLLGTFFTVAMADFTAFEVAIWTKHKLR
jgi:hypothetical protein